MSVKPFLASMIGMVTLIVASVQGHAFMNEVTRDAEAGPPEAPAAEAITERVEVLHDQVAGDEVECSEMLTRLDDLLTTIDQALDAGVAEADEETFLAARGEVVDMRLDLPCLGESSLVQAGGGEAEPVGEEGFEEETVGESVLVSAPGQGPLPSGGGMISGGAPVGGSAGSGISRGGYAGARPMGGGGGGGFGGGGGGLGLMSAAAAAIAIPIATADDDDPGQPATPAGF